MMHVFFRIAALGAAALVGTTSAQSSLGCYADDQYDRVLEAMHTSSRRTPLVCTDYCRTESSRYAYYATQWGKECWCQDANIDLKHGFGTDCSGDSSIKCGGYDSFTLYDLEDADSPSSPTDSPSSPTESNCLGCYADDQNDRVLDDAMISSSRMTSDEPRENPHSEVRESAASLPAELSGWDLVQKLHSIGLDNPGELARILEEEDPFKVAVSSPDRFQCPTNEAERFSLPDMREHSSEEAFKAGKGFIYYQHLRKAGGTGFCEMASRNMAPREVPRYHCMPDDRGAMATPPWSNQYFFFGEMQRNGYRITANEWDAFPMDHLYLPGAVFATTFRHPADRWYSQYRFEHVEHRDGSRPDKPSWPFDEWYRRQKPYSMGDNYYVKTFCGQRNPSDGELMRNTNLNDLSWSYRKFYPWKEKVSWEALKTSIEVLQRFHLILILDFVDDEMWALNEALGWDAARKQVLPHEAQAVRASRKSISAREALPSEVWSELMNANVFDVLLFHWAKRMYLERSACRSFDQEAISQLPTRRATELKYDRVILAT